MPPKTTPKTARTLLYAAAAQQDPRHLEAFAKLFQGVSDVSFLVDAAVREGLVCVLYRSIVGIGRFKDLSAANQKKLAGAYYRTAAANTRRLHDLAELLGTLEPQGVVPVVLQGAALLADVYPDIGLRPMVDVDLWVAPENRKIVDARLKSLGYAQDLRYPESYRRRDTKFDVRSHLLWADRIPSRGLLLDVDLQTILERTIEIPLQDILVRILAPFDQAVYLALHCLKHGANRLLWLADLQPLTGPWGKNEWRHFAKTAGDWGALKPAAWVFLLLKRLAGPAAVSIPANRLLPTGLSPVERRLLHRRLQSKFLPAGASEWLLSAGKPLKLRILHQWAALFPEPDVLRQIFGVPESFPPWRLYLMRIAEAAGIRSTPYATSPEFEVFRWGEQNDRTMKLIR